MLLQLSSASSNDTETLYHKETNYDNQTIQNIKRKRAIYNLNNQRWPKSIDLDDNGNNLSWCWPHFLTLILISWLCLCIMCVPACEAVGYSYTRFVGPVRGPELEIVTDDPLTGTQHLDYVAKPEYEFSYGVEDADARILHNRNEIRDGDEVKGVYSLVDPDGTLRVVKYTADGVNGFQAEVITNGLSTLHGHQQPSQNNGQAASAGPASAPNSNSGSSSGTAQYHPGSFRPNLPTFVSPAYIYQKQQQELLQKHQQQQQQNHLPGIITNKLTPPGSELQVPNQYNPYDPRTPTTVNHNANNNNNNNNNNSDKNDAKDSKPNYKVRENPKDNNNESDDSDDDEDYESNDDEDSREGKKKKYHDTEENDDDDEADDDDDEEDYEEDVEDYDDNKKKPKKHSSKYADSNEEY